MFPSNGDQNRAPDALPTPVAALARRRACLSLLLAVLVSATATTVAAQPLKIEGDLFVDPAPTTRGVMHVGEALWDYGIIPVWVDPDLDADTADVARRSMAVWNAAVGVTLMEVESLTQPEFDHVHLQPGEGCASWVGRRGGAQELWIAPDCSGGSVIHELGHVIGLEHEHTRSDRDAWIRINWDNVRDDKRHNFALAPEGSRLLGAYDYASIMHYGPTYFSVNGLSTIEPLHSGAAIGQRLLPSDGDIASVAELYGSDLAITSSLYETDIADVHELDVIVSNEGSQGAHAIEFDLAVPAGWLVLGAGATTDAWVCEASPDQMEADAVEPTTCRLQRLAAGEQARVTLALSHADREATTRLENQTLAVAPLRLSLHSQTDELAPHDNVYEVIRLEDSDATRTSIAEAYSNASAGAGNVVINPFVAQQDDPALWAALLDDQPYGDSVMTLGGAIHPGLALGLMLLWRRRYCVAAG